MHENRVWNDSKLRDGLMEWWNGIMWWCIIYIAWMSWQGVGCYAGWIRNVPTWPLREQGSRVRGVGPFCRRHALLAVLLYWWQSLSWTDLIFPMMEHCLAPVVGMTVQPCCMWFFCRVSLFDSGSYWNRTERYELAALEFMPVVCTYSISSRFKFRIWWNCMHDVKFESTFP
jgi:hypothetical protein